MNLRSETSQFLLELESYAKRPLTYAAEVGQLLDVSRVAGKIQLFEDAVFNAKFIVKSYDLMGRIGSDEEGYEKVASEFQSGMERAVSLLKNIIEGSPDEAQKHFKQKFFQLDQESISSLMQLLRDLAWVKNWTVDGKPLP